MKKHLKQLLFILIALPFVKQSQNLSYANSVYQQSGEPGIMVTPQLEITNTGIASTGVHVKRISTSLPLNWTTCFCYIECNPPELSELTFTLVPGEKAYIGIGFGTDMIPGTGTVAVTVEELNSSAQKDTLTFVASTIVSSLTERSAISQLHIFPNPASEKIVVRNGTFSFLQIIDSRGLVIAVFSGTSEIPLNNLNAGVYTLLITDSEGNRLTKKFIKD